MSKKVLAVASNGGHLVQLLRLSPAFESKKVAIVSTSDDPPSLSFDFEYYSVSDSNFSKKLLLVKTALETMLIYTRVRPDVVISTGAAPGLMFIVFGSLCRKKCIWVDSIANTETLSLAGRVASKLTPYCFSQWPCVAKKCNVRYIGAVV